jgi:thiol-disulfide isomerase/thioredoxin
VVRTDRKIRDRAIRRPSRPADFVFGPAPTRRTSLALIGAAAFAPAALVPAGFAPAARAASPPLPERYETVDPPEPVPDAPFIAHDGALRRIGDFRGRHVFLHLWATWCPICAEETPTVLRLAQSLRLAGAADRLTFVLLSIDKNLDAVRRHVAEHGYDRAIVYVDPERRLMAALGAVGTPTTLLIDDAGRIVGAAEGRVGWDREPALGLVRRTIGLAAG